MLMKNTTTLAMISAIVTTGRFRVPMLSFRGNTGRRRRLPTWSGFPARQPCASSWAEPDLAPSSRGGRRGRTISVRSARRPSWSMSARSRNSQCRTRRHSGGAAPPRGRKPRGSGLPRGRSPCPSMAVQLRGQPLSGQVSDSFHEHPYALPTDSTARERSGEGGERPRARLALGHVLVGVVARPHERAGGDVLEAERVRGALQGGELVRVPVAHDREVLLGRAEVLADGEDLHAVLAEDAERLDELVVRLAEPDQQAGLRRHLVAAHLLRVAWDAARAQELRPAARERVEARDDLDVVVEDVGPLGDHLRERHLLAAEVRRQHLDLAGRGLTTDLADDADERRRAVVRQVVAVDAGDHRVAQAHPRDRARDAGGLERVVPRRLAGLDVAEAAPAGAGVAEDHERRGAAVPAVADVRARRLLAHGVEVLVLDEAVELAVARAPGRLDLEPRRLAVADREHVGPEDREDVHAAGIGARPGLVLARTRSAHTSGIYRG